MAKRTPSITAQEIKSFVDKQDKLTLDLRNIKEDHADFLRDDWFVMPGKHPENYEKMPTTNPLAFKNKITSELASGILKRSIPYVGKESKVTKSDISLTERASYGLTGLANKRLQSMELPTIQAQVADDIALRGWVCKRIWLYEEKEHGAPKLIVDVAVWDIINVRSALGKNGMKCIVNLRYATEEEVKDEYGDDGNYPVDSQGRVLIYDWWDKEWEVVAIGGYVVDSQFHNKGYVPAYKMPVGSNRLRQSERHQDTIKFVGQDFASYGGDIVWPVQSRIMSYYLTTVALGTHPVQKLKYKGAQNIPVFADPKTLYESGVFIPLDEEKGQAIAPMFKPSLPSEPNALFSIVDGEKQGVTAPEIFFGKAPATITAQGTAMLIHSAMGVLKDGKKAMEQADAWEANELIRQFKDGKFSEVELQGADGKQKQFDVSVSTKKLVTNRDIVSELLLDIPQDEMAKVDIGAKLKSLRWISDQTGMDKFAGVADPDSEQERIALEAAGQLMGLDDYKVLEQLLTEKPPGWQNLAWIVYGNIQQKVSTAKQMAQQGQAGDISALGQMNPMAGQTKMPPQGMTPQGNENARLGALNLTRGR